MPRFDVYAGRNGRGYLMDVQANGLSRLRTRIVVPLMPVASMPARAASLNPLFDVNGDRVCMLTQALSMVHASQLRRPVANLDRHAPEIADAIDFVRQGW